MRGIAIALGVAVSCFVPAAAAAPAGSGESADATSSSVPPELPAEVYERRRERLMGRLGGCAAAIRSFSGEREPDPDFYYLTGVEENEALLVLAPRSPLTRSALYFEPRDEEAEIWTGYREEMSPALRSKYRVDQVGRVRGGLPRALRSAMRRTRCFASLRSALSDKSDVDAGLLGKLLASFEASKDMRWQVLESMRAVKDEEELARMRRAIAITAEGHRAAARFSTVGRKERQVAAKIEEAFYAHGATGVAFPSIVGSGPNGAVLHWIKNDRALASGDLVVVDIGSSYGHYASDITRTYPVSGSFTDEQKKVYEIVLAAQEKVIAAVRPGVSLDQLHRIAEDFILEAGYEMPHSIGHFVGLEVHDVGDRGAPLEAGMVITVEPGIYLEGQLGVRIEDMVLVTPRGGEVMSRELPRDVAGVEAFLKAARR